MLCYVVPLALTLLHYKAYNYRDFTCVFSGYAILLWMICITFNLFMNAVLQKDTAKYEM